MTDRDVIYLDHNASTPCDPRVVAAMLPFFERIFANPSSRSHAPGQAAAAALDDARARVASALGARSSAEIIFTSGATEANNLALAGAAMALAPARRHLVSQATEHPSVLEPLRRLEHQGWELSVVGVDRRGILDRDGLEAALREDTALVSLMLANNETGAVQPLREAAELAHRCGAVVHCDAAQGPGKLPFTVGDLGVDLLTLSGHKVYGPKGIGALYLRRGAGLPLEPQLLGGGHERGLRSGTPNLPAAVGLAVALELAAAELDAESRRVRTLRDELEGRLLASLDGCSVNGAGAPRLPNTSNLSFAGVEGNALLASLRAVAVSSGSACASVHPETSPVLRAMGVPKALAAASIRISLGRSTTSSDVEAAVAHITTEVRRLRSLSRGGRR